MYSHWDRCGISIQLSYLSDVTCLQPFPVHVDWHSLYLLGVHCLSQFQFVSNVIKTKLSWAPECRFTSHIGSCIWLQVPFFHWSLFLQSRSANSTTFTDRYSVFLLQTRDPQKLWSSLNFQETLSSVRSQYPPEFFCRNPHYPHRLPPVNTSSRLCASLLYSNRALNNAFTLPVSTSTNNCAFSAVAKHNNQGILTIITKEQDR